MKCRIKSRHDVLSNWVSSDIVLLDGEIAVVDCGVQTRFKVGDGEKSFTQLPFVDQSQLSTKALYAEHVSQGIHASSAPYGLAAGAYLCADASFSQAFGYNSQTVSSDQYSFVWNGDDTKAIGDYYTSHGKGTFSINPLSGLSGFYLGEDNLAQILAENGSKTTIDDRICGVVDQTDLSIVKLNAEDYAQIVATSSMISNCLYVVESSCMNAYGQQLKNLAAPTDLSDATTKEYVDNAISNVEIPTDLSSFSNSPGYVKGAELAQLFSQVNNPKSSVNSLVETMTSVLNILKNLQ